MELNIINDKIGQLRTAEGQVKSLVAELIVAVTDRIHEHNDVDSANRFILALTPINRKKALSFFKAHGGHKIEEGIITKRIKDTVRDGVKHSSYTESHDAYEAFKASDMTFWQWAVMNKPKVENKMTVDILAKKASKLRDLMQEAMGDNVVDKAQVLTMMLGDLMTAEDVMNILASMSTE